MLPCFSAVIEYPIADKSYWRAKPCLVPQDPEALARGQRRAVGADARNGEAALPLLPVSVRRAGRTRGDDALLSGLCAAVRDDVGTPTPPDEDGERLPPPHPQNFTTERLPFVNGV
jgi:hypothetical protein